MKFQKIFISIVIVFVISNIGLTQVDNILWSSMRLRTLLNEKTRLDIRPIMRHNNNISDFQNSSIDIAIRRKLKNGWFVQLLGRTWFMPNAHGRQFIWPDVGHSFTYNNINITNRVRWHLALDLGGFQDNDFIRWQTVIAPKVDWPIKPFLAIEPWVGLNGTVNLKRMRYEPGINWSISKAHNLTVMYRRQNAENVDPGVDQNHYVVTFTYQEKK